MTIEQADAILNYLEFHLLTFVEETDQHMSDPDFIGDMYDRAYKILADFEGTLDTQVLLDNKHLLTSKKKQR